MLIVFCTALELSGGLRCHVNARYKHEAQQWAHISVLVKHDVLGWFSQGAICFWKLAFLASRPVIVDRVLPFGSIHLAKDPFRLVGRIQLERAK